MVLSLLRHIVVNRIMIGAAIALILPFGVISKIAGEIERGIIDITNNIDNKIDNKMDNKIVIKIENINITSKIIILLLLFYLIYIFSYSFFIYCRVYPPVY